MLVMTFWRDQYATPYDERDIALYPNPFFLPPEQNTPPYVTPMVEFSYYGGLSLCLLALAKRAIGRRSIRFTKIFRSARNKFSIRRST